MYSISGLFQVARLNPKLQMNNPARLMGKHCRARLLRAVAKRTRRGQRPYTPAAPAPLATE